MMYLIMREILNCFVCRSDVVLPNMIVYDNTHNCIIIIFLYYNYKIINSQNYNHTLQSTMNNCSCSLLYNIILYMYNVCGCGEVEIRILEHDRCHSP